MHIGMMLPDEFPEGKAKLRMKVGAVQNDVLVVIPGAC